MKIGAGNIQTPRRQSLVSVVLPDCVLGQPEFEMGKLFLEGVAALGCAPIDLHHIAGVFRKPLRQMKWTNGLAATVYKGTLDDVLQLTHVARPRIILQTCQGVGINLRQQESKFARIDLKKVSRKQGNVFGALTKGR